ncbi:MAG: DNA-directed DNA polymerase I [Caldisphaeraceae archaeon]|nr:DNA-directed DNA polymerase I [Caldisphaeraceae archaeon]
MPKLLKKRQTSIDEFINDIKKKVNGNTTNGAKEENKKLRPKTKFRDLTEFLSQEAEEVPSNLGKGGLGEALKENKKDEEVSAPDKELAPDKEIAHFHDVEVKKKSYKLEEKSEGIEHWNSYEENKYYDEASGYLMEIRYEGDLGKAVALIYDDKEKKIKKWIDKTGHKPYFLTDMRINDEKAVDLSRYKFFSNYAVVTKKNPITNSNVKLVKVVVEDPLSVKNLRSIIKGKGFNVWEADIKYYLNYIYDNQIIPGMPYELKNKWDPRQWKADESLADFISKSFPSNLKDLALSWIPILEEKAPNVERVSIDIEVYTPEGHFPNPEDAYYPIISIALADNKGRKEVLLLYREGTYFTGKPPEAEIEIFDNEKALILEAIRRVTKYPIVVTFNGDNFDLPYLYNRLLSLGLEPEDIPLVFHQDYITFQNSLHIDLHKLFDIKALQTYAFSNKYREKSLDSVAEALLGSSKIKLTTIINDVSLDELSSYNLQDSVLTISLTTFSNNLVWNLLMLLMRISRMGLEEISRTQVSAWIRNILFWEHRRRNMLIPNREDISSNNIAPKSTAIIKDKRYRGAIVLTPAQGVYFNVLVLDFASLYPSIIRNWNISYETVNNPYCKGEYVRVPEVNHVICMERKGISSEIVGLLRDFRVKIYKKKAKNKELSEEERLWYDTVQAAMKVYINASYGVFGTETFSLYSLPVAESVTAIGRNVLMDALRKASELDLHILYGDTDSLFLWDPPKEKLEEIVQYVKKKYDLDLEIDKVFKIVLFSGLKKNYIGIDGNNKVTIKGLIAKKSNTPEFIKSEFSSALSILQNLKEPEEVEETLARLRDLIQGIYQKLKRREYTLDQLAITVMLSKGVDEYERNTPQHVKAALLLKKEGFNVSKGDVISFVKTKDKVGVRPVRLAKLSEVDTSKYVEYVKSALEQFLLAFGVQWDELIGVRKLG